MDKAADMKEAKYRTRIRELESQLAELRSAAKALFDDANVDTIRSIFTGDFYTVHKDTVGKLNDAVTESEASDE